MVPSAVPALLCITLASRPAASKLDTVLRPLASVTVVEAAPYSVIVVLAVVPSDDGADATITRPRPS
ncbi:hypothetical protein ACAN107058_14685 [Paracidovorax anthurii]